MLGHNSNSIKRPNTNNANMQFAYTAQALAVQSQHYISFTLHSQHFISDSIDSCSFNLLCVLHVQQMMMMGTGLPRDSAPYVTMYRCTFGLMHDCQFTYSYSSYSIDTPLIYLKLGQHLQFLPSYDLTPSRASTFSVRVIPSHQGTDCVCDHNKIMNIIIYRVILKL